jgi:hypothetical protein
MNDGVRLREGRVTLDGARARCKDEIARLPSPVRGIQPAIPQYRVDVSAALARDLEAFQRNHHTAESSSGRGDLSGSERRLR